MAISFPQIGLEARSTVPRVALRPDLGFMSAAGVIHTVPCEPAQQDAGDSVILRSSSNVAEARCEMPRLPSHPQLHDRALQQLLRTKGSAAMRRSAASSESASKLISPPDRSANGAPRYSDSARSRQYAACCGATVLTRSASSFIQ